MLYLICEIAVCFFAVIGAASAVLGFFDAYTARKAGVSAKLVITDIGGRVHTEYALRIVESLLHHSALAEAVKEIVVDANAQADGEAVERVAAEYGNIRHENE